MTHEADPEITEPTTPETGRDPHTDHLDRSERVWDRWSSWYGPSERDLEPFRAEAIERLDVGRGDRVLDVGCGPGVNFQRLRDIVGPGGEIVGVDYSAEMVQQARVRIEEHGWSNVRVRRDDAVTADFEEGFDAAVATLSMSVLPDVEDAVVNVRDALLPDGAFVVFDLRTIPEGPGRVLNPLLERCLYWIANWNPDGDVLGALDEAFEACEVTDTYAAGISFVAVARRRTAGREVSTGTVD